MKWISVVLVAALLVQIGYMPCAAHEVSVLKHDVIGQMLRTRRAGSDIDRPKRVVPGARVRINAPSVCKRQVVGTLVTWDADTLVVEPQSGTWLSIPHTSLMQLEVSLGKKSWGPRMAAGFLAGTLALGVYTLTGERCYEDEDAASPVLVCALLGGLPGALVGGLIARADEKWQPVPLDRIRVGVIPQRHGGAMLSVSFGF